MRTWCSVGKGLPPRLIEVPLPEPGPGEMLVKSGGAGVCHFDLHLLEVGREGGASTFTLVHENAGWVAKMGASAKGVKEGDAVAVYGCWGCGRCRACLLSCENYCTGRTLDQPALFGGPGGDGGMAEYMLVSSTRHLVALSKIEPYVAAPPTDAALTPYHAICRTKRLLLPGVAVALIGVGGLGHVAIQILKAISLCRVVALDIDDSKLGLAARHGATLVVNCKDCSLPELCSRVRPKEGCSVVFDCVGSNGSMATAAVLAGMNSQIMVLGLVGGSLAFEKNRCVEAHPSAFPAGVRGLSFLGSSTLQSKD